MVELAADKALTYVTAAVT